MRKSVAILSVLGFLAALGVSPGIPSDFVTGCIKQKGNGDPKKNTTVRRVAKGTSPGSSCSSKQVEVTWPTDQVTDDLQQQIDDLDAQINDPGGLQEMVQMNKDDISTLQTDLGDLETQVDAIVTSSLIGGDIQSGDSISPGTTEFIGMFGSKDTDTASDDMVTQNMAAAGVLTDLLARSQAPSNGTMTLTIRQGPPAGSTIDTSLTCTIADGTNECSGLSCVVFAKGDLISVKVANSGDASVGEIRWNARFIENGTCGP